jgi:zinc transport system substrate-binding protein
VRKFNFLIILSLIFFAFSCSGKNSSGKPLISVSIYPFWDIVKNLAGDEVDVSLIIPPGSSPHTFELTPGIMKKIQASAAVVYVGLNLEAFVDKVKSQYPDKKYFVLSKYAEKYRYSGLMLEAEEDGHENGGHVHNGEHSHHHRHNGFDPHIWLDPVNVIKLLPKIKDLLVSIIPSKKERFEKLADDYKKKLTSLDNYIKKKVLAFKSRKIVTFHGAYLYFAKRYGMKIVAVFEPFAGRSPAVSYRKKLIKAIRKNGVKAVFYEPQFNRGEIETLANEAGAKTAMLDPIGSKSFSNRSTYVDLLKFNINSMEKLLK